MRINKYGVRGLKSVLVGGRLQFFWTPPVSLQKARIFRHKSLGTDFQAAIAKARDWNGKLEAYRHSANGIKPVLAVVRPMTVGYLVRQFEASPRFARYSSRTQQDYSWVYRSVEAQIVDGCRMFGDMKMSEITRQIAYAIYEQNVREHGHDFTNKSMGAWQVAFRYGMFKFAEIASNPFSDLDKISSPARRQRWTDKQLGCFIERANELGYPAVGRCALLCMELMQRPGDILSLKWGAYDEHEKVWHIRQSKRGTVVRIPETCRLSVELRYVRCSLKDRYFGDIGQLLVCPTITGKRWHRRNFTKTARRIARAAGLPDDLQIRDLRRTAATEGASAGATPAEMMAVGGWSNPASIRPYLVQTLEQAQAFQAKREAYRRHLGVPDTLAVS